MNKSNASAVSSFVAIPKKVRKLPLWGEQVEPEEIDFEWPNEEVIQSLPEDVSLESITFKKVFDDVISSVNCTLSNGESSGAIEAEGVEHEAPSTITFDP